MNEQKTPYPLPEQGRVLTPEQSDYDLAMYLVADMESRLETACMARDKVLQAHFHDLHSRALGMSHRAWARLQASKVPSFEAVLRDPESQMDREGVVMKSILAYQNAPTGTACACGKCPSCLGNGVIAPASNPSGNAPS